MGRRRDSILDTLLVSPWWISVILAIAAYVGLGYIIPGLEVTNIILRGPAQAAPMLAPMVAALLGVAALFSSLRTWHRRQLLDSQYSIEEIRKLDWRDFERLVGEAFRRKGYTRHERGQNGPDGGVDLELFRGSDKILVQCKHWKTGKVGVGTVRELFGVMVAEGASDAIFVTSGQYSREAWLFAKDNNLALFDGPRLIELLDSVRSESTASGPAPVFKPVLSVLVYLDIIVGALWLGNPVHDHKGLQTHAQPGITNQPRKVAIETQKKQEIDVLVQH